MQAVFSSGYNLLPGQFTIAKDGGRLGLTYFEIIQSLFLTAYGAKKVVLDHSRVTPASGRFSWISRLWQSVFLGKSAKTSDYPAIEGALLCTSGFYSSLAALHQLDFLNLGPYKTLCVVLGDSLFIGANVVAITYNIDLYYRAASCKDGAAIRSYSSSSVLGVVSSSNYILATFVPIIGLPNGVALVFGCFAVSTGIIKVVYDYLHQN